MSEWPLSLRMHQDEAHAGELLRGTPHSATSSSAMGTFRVDHQGAVTITHSRRGLDDPMSFVATMAHELAHYLMHTVEALPPGGADAEEPATDVCCAFLGFGVFAANAAFSFSQFSDGQMAGWEARRQGYLDEPMLAMALGVFLELRRIDESAVLPLLKTNPRAYLRRALKLLRAKRRADIARLRGV